MRLDRCRLAFGPNEDHLCEWCGVALPPLRRRWCSDACSLAWRDNHVWSFAREAALERAGRRCERCADPEDIEVHHDPPVGAHGYGSGCHHHQDRLAVLCVAHHAEAHRVMRAKPGTATQLSLVA